MLTNKHWNGRIYKDTGSSYWKFIKWILRSETVFKYPSHSWLKMRERQGFPSTGEDIFIPCLRFDVDDYSAKIFRDLQYIDRIVDEAVQYYHMTSRPDNHKFSWEVTDTTETK